MGDFFFDPPPQLRIWGDPDPYVRPPGSNVIWSIIIGYEGVQLVATVATVATLGMGSMGQTFSKGQNLPFFSAKLKVDSFREM